MSTDNFDGLIDAAIREKALLEHLDELEAGMQKRQARRKYIIWSIVAAAGLVVGIFFAWHQQRARLQVAYAQAIDETAVFERGAMRSDSLDSWLTEARSSLQKGDSRQARIALDRLQNGLDAQRKAIVHSSIEGVLLVQLDDIQYEAEWLYALSHMKEGNLRQSRKALEKVAQTANSPYRDAAAGVLKRYFHQR